MEDAYRILASELAAQLPADFAEAGMVIGYMDQLRHWRAGKPFPPQFTTTSPHEVVSFSRREGVGGASKPSR